MKHRSSDINISGPKTRIKNWVSRIYHNTQAPQYEPYIHGKKESTIIRKLSATTLRQKSMMLIRKIRQNTYKSKVKYGITRKNDNRDKKAQI